MEVDPQVAGVYELFLAARGRRVIAVSSPGAALRTASGEPPLAVIIGGLPDSIDSGTLAARLRAVVSPHELAIVVMAPTLDEVPGADLVIPRGSHPRALADALRTALRRRQNTQPLATAL